VFYPTEVEVLATFDVTCQGIILYDRRAIKLFMTKVYEDNLNFKHTHILNRTFENALKFRHL
jgi:hypothetical protein